MWNIDVAGASAKEIVAVLAAMVTGHLDKLFSVMHSH